MVGAQKRTVDTDASPTGYAHGAGNTGSLKRKGNFQPPPHPSWRQRPLPPGLPYSDTPEDDFSYLYAIECGPFFKVGISRDVEQRINEMLLMNPYEPRLALYRTIRRRWVRITEQRVHSLLAEWHHRREWFTAPLPEVRAAVRTALLETAKLDREEQNRIRSINEAIQVAKEAIIQDAWERHAPPDLRPDVVWRFAKRLRRAVAASRQAAPLPQPVHGRFAG